MYQAKDAMSARVVSLSPGDTLETAARTLLENQISGAPVLDELGELVGIVSEFSLLEACHKSDGRSALVGDCMTRDVDVVHADTPLSIVASMFVDLRVRRMPVVRDGRLEGVIARRDVLRYILEYGNPTDNYPRELERLMADIV
ncbi:MAG: CBS domain-containing protein [Pirellulales bacterium]